MNIKTPTFIAIGLLVVALFPMPYGYYTLVRLCICLYSVFLAYKFWQENIDVWMWIVILIAVLFNPLIPIYLGRVIWAIIDILTAIILFISITNIDWKVTAGD